MLTITSPRGALALDAASFLGSAVLLRYGLNRRPARRAGGASMTRDSLRGIRGVLAHRRVRRLLLFSWLVPACAVAPEALAAPYASHIGEPVRVVGYLLMAIPAGTVLADLIAARMLRARAQRRLIVPAALLGFVPLAGFAASPALGVTLALLVISGLGSAWGAGLDGLMIAEAPEELRGRVLGLASAGLMFIQGAGFALWGIATQYLPVTVVIPAAAAAGILVVLLLRPAPGAPDADCG
jgi:hypothetical protein